jgi:thiamine biosynthesis lipoprotein
MRFNNSRSTDWFPVSKNMVILAGEALRVAEMSGGAFDPTVAPLVRLWGFGPARKAEHRVPTQKEIDAARARVGWKKLVDRADPPALKKSQPDLSVDLSALTCGFAIDELAAKLDALGVQNYLIELGGALRARGVSQRGMAWRTGIEQPVNEPQRHRGAEDFERGKLECVVELAGKSISTSGSYKQFFTADGRAFSHIIDARTGWPLDDKLVSVTVVADTCLEADAMDTALMTMGAEAAWNLASGLGLSALFVTHEGDGFARKMTPEFRKLIVPHTGEP